MKLYMTFNVSFNEALYDLYLPERQIRVPKNYVRKGVYYWEVKL